MQVHGLEWKVIWMLASYWKNNPILKINAEAGQSRETFLEEFPLFFFQINAFLEEK